MPYLLEALKKIYVHKIKFVWPVDFNYAQSEQWVEEGNLLSMGFQVDK